MYDTIVACYRHIFHGAKFNISCLFRRVRFYVNVSSWCCRSYIVQLLRDQVVVALPVVVVLREMLAKRIEPVALRLIEKLSPSHLEFVAMPQVL